ncbi:MAG TPA: hypothetical protein VLH56_08580 [Dissulfurispiraceae bacterium]|nr:hypothetical protein [Dissulfurispiraceae bacterium]
MPRHNWGFWDELVDTDWRELIPGLRHARRAAEAHELREATRRVATGAPQETRRLIPQPLPSIPPDPITVPEFQGGVRTIPKEPPITASLARDYAVVQEEQIKAEELAGRRATRAARVLQLLKDQPTYLVEFAFALAKPLIGIPALTAAIALPDYYRRTTPEVALERDGRFLTPRVYREEQEPLEAGMRSLVGAATEVGSELAAGGFRKIIGSRWAKETMKRVFKPGGVIHGYADRLVKLSRELDANHPWLPTVRKMMASSALQTPPEEVAEEVLAEALDAAGNRVISAARGEWSEFPGDEEMTAYSPEELAIMMVAFGLPIGGMMGMAKVAQMDARERVLRGLMRDHQMTRMEAAQVTDSAIALRRVLHGHDKPLVSEIEPAHQERLNAIRAKAQAKGIQPESIKSLEETRDRMVEAGNNFMVDDVLELLDRWVEAAVDTTRPAAAEAPQEAPAPVAVPVAPPAQEVAPAAPQAVAPQVERPARTTQEQRRAAIMEGLYAQQAEVEADVRTLQAMRERLGRVPTRREVKDAFHTNDMGAKGLLTRAFGEERADVRTPSKLEGMDRKQLAEQARKYGVPVKGTNAALRLAIQQARRAGRRGVGEGEGQAAEVPVSPAVAPELPVAPVVPAPEVAVEPPVAPRVEPPVVRQEAPPPAPVAPPVAPAQVPLPPPMAAPPPARPVTPPAPVPPVAAPAPPPAPPKPPAATGIDSEIVTRDYKVSTRFAVSEAENLITSNDPITLAPAAEYPRHLQQRQRQRVATEEQLEDIRKNLDTEMLAESRLASAGAPVTSEGVVESGNVRTMALKRFYEQGLSQAQEYRTWLINNAQRFGLDPDLIRRMRHPILHRERTTPLSEQDRFEYVRQANEETVARMSASEQALTDARLLDETLMNMFHPSEEGEINTASNRSFIRNFLGRVSAAELGDLQTEEGTLSQQGIIRLRNALFAKAYGDSPVLQQMAESPDQNTKNILNAMVVVAGKMTNLNAQIEKGSRHDLSIASAINEAARKLSALREQGQPVSQYLKQTQMFEEGVSTEAKAILGVFDQYKRSSKRIADFFNRYLAAVNSIGPPAQMSLLGEKQIPNRLEIIEAVMEDMQNETTGLFGEAVLTQPPGGRAASQETPPDLAPDRERAEETIARREGETRASVLTDSTGEIKTTSSHYWKAVRDSINQVVHQLGFTGQVGIDLQPGVEARLTQQEAQQYPEGEAVEGQRKKADVDLRTGRITFYEGTSMENVIQTTAEELFHLAMEGKTPQGRTGLFRQAEIDALNRQYPNSERAAHAFAEYASGRMNKKGMIRRAFDKVLDIIKGTLDRLGVRRLTAKDVFNRVLSGQVGRRGFTAERLMAQKSQELRASVMKREIRDINELYAELFKERTIFDTLLPEKDKKVYTDEELQSQWDEVEEQWKRDKGIKKPGWFNRTREVFKKLRRYSPYIDPKKSTQHAAVNNLLRQASASPVFGSMMAEYMIYKISQKLNPGQVELFTKILVLRDLAKDIESGKYGERKEDGTYQKKIPRGYETLEELYTDLSHYETLARQDSTLTDALNDRQDKVKVIAERLVQLGLLPEDVLTDLRYYHRQILKYANEPDHLMTAGTGRLGIQEGKKGFQREREGAELPYNTDYFESEYEWMRQAFAMIARAEATTRIGQLVNTMPRLESLAKQHNLHAAYGGKEIYEEVQNLLEQLEEADSKEEKNAIRTRLDEIDVLRNYRRKFAIGVAQLMKMAQQNNLPAGAYQNFPRTIEALNQNVLLFEQDVAGNIFTFLQWLMTQEHNARGPAAGILKAIAEKNRTIKEAAGDNFKTWKDFMPEGHTEFEPQVGQRMFRGVGLTESEVESLVRTGKTMVPLSKLREVTISAGPKEMWVIPTDIADGLNHYKSQRSDNEMNNLWESAIGRWKQWMLLNPVRAIRYNINNISGDLDICVAYDPRIITKYGWKAARDLYYFHVKRREGKLSQEVESEIMDSVRLGVTQSGLSIEEIPDIGRTRFLKRIQGKKDPIMSRIFYAYWDRVGTYTTWRENILRLAAYRYFLDKVKKGEKVYGASSPFQLDAVHDENEKAAKLARELVGDYGNISHGGRWLRTHLLPFYSWMEVNAPRYVRLMRNAPLEGRRETKWRVGTALGLRGLGKTGKMLVQAQLLMGMVRLWNKLFFPEEDEYVAEMHRGNYIILGNRDDGSIRYLRFEGAFADALRWFNLHDYPNDIRDLIQGDQDIEDMLADAVKGAPDRIINAWEPLSKTTFEMAFGRSTFPSVFEEGKLEKGKPVFRTRQIRDRAEHVARTLALGGPYRRLRNIPERRERSVGDMVMDLISYEIDPGEAAYFLIRGKVSEWRREQGHTAPVIEATERGNALHYYKLALRSGNEEAAEYWSERYFSLEGTRQGMERSIDMSAPLGGLSSQNRIRFRNSLNERDEMFLDEAIEWYRERHQR